MVAGVLLTAEVCLLTICSGSNSSSLCGPFAHECMHLPTSHKQELLLLGDMREVAPDRLVQPCVWASLLWLLCEGPLVNKP